MSLLQYKKKRDFTQTPEPVGGKTQHESLVFVVQKHAASHLHYDLRIELGGVLKSWAVPKGPSLNPSDKRLAMMVEDHPYDYKDFEGTIAPGNYGAGTVIVWDKGIAEPLEGAASKKEQEKILLKQLKEGSLKFRLNGSKLKGEFALVRTAYAKNSWLLIKHNDDHAQEADITQLDKSVVSGKSLEELTSKKKPNGSSDNASPSQTSHTVAVKKNTAGKRQSMSR